MKGEIIPNNSLVNLEDLLYRTPSDPLPTNANGLQTLMCVTDRVACCESPELGNWYHPDGTRVVLVDDFIARFQSNRGQNEVNGNEQFYGSVRLWQKYTPTDRGLFHCELPDAENVIHTLYVNICKFPMIFCTSVEFFPHMQCCLATLLIISQLPCLPLILLLLEIPAR